MRTANYFRFFNKMLFASPPSLVAGSVLPSFATPAILSQSRVPEYVRVLVRNDLYTALLRSNDALARNPPVANIPFKTAAELQYVALDTEEALYKQSKRDPEQYLDNALMLYAFMCDASLAPITILFRILINSDLDNLFIKERNGDYLFMELLHSPLPASEKTRILAEINARIDEARAEMVADYTANTPYVHSTPIVFSAGPDTMNAIQQQRQIYLDHLANLWQDVSDAESELESVESEESEGSDRGSAYSDYSSIPSSQASAMASSTAEALENLFRSPSPSLSQNKRNSPSGARGASPASSRASRSTRASQISQVSHASQNSRASTPFGTPPTFPTPPSVKSTDTVSSHPTSVSSVSSATVESYASPFGGGLIPGTSRTPSVHSRASTQPSTATHSSQISTPPSVYSAAASVPMSLPPTPTPMSPVSSPTPSSQAPSSDSSVIYSQTQTLTSPITGKTYLSEEKTCYACDKPVGNTNYRTIRMNSKNQPVRIVFCGMPCIERWESN